MAQQTSKKSVFVTIFILLLITSIMLAACSGEEEPQSVDVGILTIFEPVGIQEGFTDLGYVEGDSINFVYDSPADMASIATEAQKLVDAEVDLIICVSTPACLAAQQATQDIPIVFFAVSNPVDAGLVTDTVEPGGNITGVASAVKDAVNEGQRLQWLKRTAPDINNVFVIYNPDDPVSATRLKALQDAANTLDLELLLAESRSNDESDAIIANIPEEAESILTFSERIYTTDALTVLADEAIAKKLPYSAPSVNLGALMSYSSDLTAMAKQSVRIADQIIKGTQAGEIPIESPEFFLTINLPAAEAIELEIPGDVLEAADDILR